MLKRPAVAIGTALVLLLTGAGVAIGKSWSNAGGVVNAQDVVHRAADVSTSSTDWRPLPLMGRESASQPCTEAPCSGETGGDFITVISKRAMSLTVSIDVRGGPVEIRARGGFRPAKARFNPGPGDTSRTFTFVTKGSKRFGCHNVSLQWRSTSGDVVTSHRSSATLLYQRPTEPPNFGCV